MDDNTILHSHQYPSIAPQTLHQPHPHHYQNLSPGHHGGVDFTGLNVDDEDGDVFSNQFHGGVVHGAYHGPPGVEYGHPGHSHNVTGQHGHTQHIQQHHHQGLHQQQHGPHQQGQHHLHSPHTPGPPNHQHHHNANVLTPTPMQNPYLSKLAASEQDMFSSPLNSDLQGSPPDQHNNPGSSTNHQQQQPKASKLPAQLVPNPPDLAAWRQRLFDVSTPLTLTESQFSLYFPHIDNVYSHRSTQHYKRKPFVSHYWDCRLKGRPPGTPKSDDPNKKKRKRVARERDLCDVKIKIVEFLPGAWMPGRSGNDALNGEEARAGSQDPATDGQGMFFGDGIDQPFPGPLTLGGVAQPGERIFTIQRVNGNGQNGKTDGVAGPHKHTLEESDAVKKNSVQRHFLMLEKARKRQGKDSSLTNDVATAAATSNRAVPARKFTGPCTATIARHRKGADYVFFSRADDAACQRVWIALEASGTPYKYVEVEAGSRHRLLAQFDPECKVPTLTTRDESWGVADAGVICEFIADLASTPGEAANGEPANRTAGLLPTDPKAKATARYWARHIDAHLQPAYDELLAYANTLPGPPSPQDPHFRTLQSSLLHHLGKLLSAAATGDAATGLSSGPFFTGPTLSWVDIHFGPLALRLRRLFLDLSTSLNPTDDPALRVLIQHSARWTAWVDALETHPAVRATVCDDVLRDVEARPWRVPLPGSMGAVAVAPEHAGRAGGERGEAGGGGYDGRFGMG